VTGITDETAMSGTATLSGATPGIVTVPAANTNPYIRLGAVTGGCRIAVGFAESGGASAVVPYVSTLADGSMVVTGQDSKQIWWKVLETDETG